MGTQDDDDQQVVVWALLGSILLLVVGLVIGIGIRHNGKGAAAASVPAVAAGASAGVGAAGSAPTGTAHGGLSGAAVGTAAAVGDAARVVVENGVVKFYFASGSAELAQGAKEALGEVVMGVAAGKKAIVSGFHDVTGDPAKNEELAKQRALAVRDALASLGIGEDKVDLRKPEVTTATGSNAEARRVEVRLE